MAERHRAEDELFRTGTRATGVVEDVEMTATEISNNPQIHLRVRIRPRAEAEFVHARRVVVPHNAVPLPGHLVEVAYDPQDRDRVALECRAGFVAPPARYIVTRPPEVGGREPADGDGWGSAWDEPAEDDYELAALERLAALRDRGALSEEEFQRQKARMGLGR